MLSPVDIKIALLRKGISAAEIGRRVGVDRSYVTHTIARRRSSRRIRRAIARAIGLSYEEVWGREEERAA